MSIIFGGITIYKKGYYSTSKPDLLIQSWKTTYSSYTCKLLIFLLYLLLASLFCFADLLNWELIFFTSHNSYRRLIPSFIRYDDCSVLFFVFRKCKGINGGIKQKSSQDRRRNTHTHSSCSHFVLISTCKKTT